MTTFQRYLLFQIPGWLLAMILLFVFREPLGLSWFTSVLLFTLYVVKDFALYPLLRRSYEVPPPGSLNHLVGCPGVAQQDLDPVGYVRVRGELWKARVVSDRRQVKALERIQIQGVEGMILLVAPAEDPAPES